MNKGHVVKAHHQVYHVADLRGARMTRPPGSKFFQFHAVFGKFWQNCMLAPTSRGLAPRPRGNPGSATVIAQQTPEPRDMGPEIPYQPTPPSPWTDRRL